MAELISIIIPVYNSEKYITETIESVLAQTYTNWEMIIVDDCSTDRSKEIIREFTEQEDRIRFIEFEENLGTGKARDVALQKAKGRFVAFLDSDDMWLPGKLEKQIRFMTENNYPISFTSYKMIDEETPWDTTTKKSVYSVSKYEAEREMWRAMAEGLEAVIVNPGVILGPGPVAMVHKENEYVDVNTLQECKKLYTNLIKRVGEIGEKR